LDNKEFYIIDAGATLKFYTLWIYRYVSR